MLFGGKLPPHLVARSVRRGLFCVSSRGHSWDRKTQEGRTGFFLHKVGKLSFSVDAWPMYFFTTLNIQKVFIEHLLCVRHCTRGCLGDKTGFLGAWEVQ